MCQNLEEMRLQKLMHIMQKYAKLCISCTISVCFLPDKTLSHFLEKQHVKLNNQYYIDYLLAILYKIQDN